MLAALGLRIRLIKKDDWVRICRYPIPVLVNALYQPKNSTGSANASRRELKKKNTGTEHRGRGTSCPLWSWTRGGCLVQNKASQHAVYSHPLQSVRTIPLHRCHSTPSCLPFVVAQHTVHGQLSFPFLEKTLLERSIQCYGAPSCRDLDAAFWQGLRNIRLQGLQRFASLLQGP